MDQSIPDLPDKLEQRKQWEAENLKAGQDKAKKTISWAKYSPLAFVIPFMNWLVDNLPGRSADGRGEAEFHYYVPRFLPWDPSRWDVIDGEVWYFTRRGDRYCDLVWTYSRAPGDFVRVTRPGGIDYQQPGGIEYTEAAKDFYELYNAQDEAWRLALPWRVKLWEDTELPGNFPLRMPQSFVDGAKVRYGYQPTENGVPLEIAQALDALVAKKKAEAAAMRGVSTFTRSGKVPEKGASSAIENKTATTKTGAGGVLVLGAAAALGAILLSRR